MAEHMTGILLMNLGSPDSTEVKDVKKYLDEFLMDKRVIDYPYLFRLLLIKGIITPKRAPRSAEAYKKIWTAEGSPLVVLTEQLRDALREEMQLPVEMCMRYGAHHPKEGLDKLAATGVKEVVLFPLYPHYAMSSYETAVEYVKEAYNKGSYPFKLKIIEPYYNEDHYISALSDSVKPYLEKEYDQILFSFHSIPKSHILKGDVTGKHCFATSECCSTPSPAHKYCYRHQCLTTMKLVVDKLNIPKEKAAFSFQSRLGREEWLKPYTALRLEELPKEGVKKLLILCPAFVSDCLETLEEIAMEGKHAFLEAGGEEFTLIPCMNLHPSWVGAIPEIVESRK